MLPESLDDPLDRPFLRSRFAADPQMRLGVDGISRLGELAEQGEGVLAGEQRPVPAASHPPGQGLDLGLEPDGDAAVEDQSPRLRIHEGAAAGRDHLALAGDQSPKHPPLAVAEARFPEPVEYLLYLMVGGALDLLVRIDEGEPEAARQPPPHRRLARPHQTDEDDRSLGRSVGRKKRLSHCVRAIQGGGSWGKRPPMRIQPLQRRRKSILPKLLMLVPILFLGWLIYLGTRDTEVPTQRIEQDVTNEALAG